MSEIPCEKCGGTDGWLIDEKICGNQDEISSVECECNTIGCGNRKKMFMNLEIIAEDFN